MAEQGRKSVADFRLVAARQVQALQPVLDVQRFHLGQQVLAPIVSDPNLQHGSKARNSGEGFAVVCEPENRLVIFSKWNKQAASLLSSAGFHVFVRDCIAVSYLLGTAVVFHISFSQHAA
jgi:hypothetical protein